MSSRNHKAPWHAAPRHETANERAHRWMLERLQRNEKPSEDARRDAVHGPPSMDQRIASGDNDTPETTESQPSNARSPGTSALAAIDSHGPEHLDQTTAAVDELNLAEEQLLEAAGNCIKDPCPVPAPDLDAKPEASSSADATRKASAAHQDLPSSLKIIPASSLPRNISVPGSAAEDFGVAATTRIEPGVLLTTQPLVSVLSNAHLDDRCSHCFINAEDAYWQKKINIFGDFEMEKNGKVPKAAAERLLLPDDQPKMLKCTSCKVVVYCSTRCQSLDWPLHKHECKALKRHFQLLYRDAEVIPCDSPDAVTRGIARLVWLWRGENGTEMRRHYDSLPDGPEKVHWWLGQQIDEAVSALTVYLDMETLLREFKSELYLWLVVKKWYWNVEASRV
ncbi:hypothetical protein OIV83_006211 [Microbotryomycetes sp. JL201]|nr:hypothetical protein OIV83_006211 [Microbotryomycetes sp. JL201]